MSLHKDRTCNARAAQLRASINGNTELSKDSCNWLITWLPAKPVTWAPDHVGPTRMLKRLSKPSWLARNPLLVEV